MPTFHPYLFFGGNCREAFTRYQEIFGGELSSSRWPTCRPTSDARRGRPTDHARRADDRRRTC